MTDTNETDQTRERLAAYAHEAWSGWMRYMFSKCHSPDGMLVIPASYVERWTRQMTTAYQGLPEDEKASDRAEADKILAIVGPLTPDTPSMRVLLTKALPLIEAEAERRDLAMQGDSDRIYTAGDYWTEMRELANEIAKGETQ